MKKIKLKIKGSDLKKRLNIKDGYTPIKGKDYFDGETPVVNIDQIVATSTTRAVERVLPTIPTLSQVAENILLDSEKIARSLETLTGKKRLDEGAIKGLDKYKTTKDFDYAIGILDQRTQFLINKTGITKAQADTYYYPLSSNPAGYLTAETDPLSLHLNQSVSQTIINGQPIWDTLTASKVVFTDASKKFTSTGIGTSSQFIKGDGSLDSSTYLTTGSASSTYVPYTGASGDVNLGIHSLLTNTWKNAAGTASIGWDGFVFRTLNDFAANTFTSTAGIGSAPFACTSTALNTNLNADLLDGNHASAFLTSVTAHNLLSTTHGDTLADSVLKGDVMIGNATPKWARLAGNTTTTKKYLQSVGAGGVAGAPTFEQVAYADISGTPNLSSYITLSSLSGTAPITYNSGTGAIGITGVDATHSGSVPLSGTPAARNFLKAAATTGAVAWDTLTSTDVGLASVTNDAQVKLSTVTTKGDLIIATGNAAVTRMGAGVSAGNLRTDGSGNWAIDATAYLSSVTAHNLLSTTHGDTTADTVVRGDIVTGQGVTPKWTRLAFPATPTGKVLIATATDVAWSASALGTAAYAATGDFLATGATAVNSALLESHNAAYFQVAGSYELNTNKATTFGTINDTLYPTVKAVNDAITSAVVGLLDYRGSYDASGNTYPATGGSGLTGAILKGDFWIISVVGTLGGNSVYVGDMVIALQDTPGQTAANWNVVEYGISYVPENAANKVISISGSSTDVQYPSAKLLYDQLAGKISTYASQTVKYFLAAPNAVDGTPSFRAIMASDIPALSYAAPLSGTINEIAYFNSATTIASLAVATYPSLTELSYVKGVTSAIQTQLNAKAATLAGTINEIAYFNSASTIASLAVATYPSLTELTYVKGVTSSIQTQIGTKAPTASPTFTTQISTPSVLATANDSGALGASGIAFSDLFLASGGVINWAVGNATITHSTGLLSINVPVDLGISNAIKVGSMEVGHATDTTISRSEAGVIAVEGVVIPSISSANTLTNKRHTPRIYTTTSLAGTPGVLTPEIDTYDYFELTAQAAALNIANKSTSTPTGGEKMIIAITSDATPRALTYGTDYVAKGGVALPTTTVASKTTTLGFIWNAGLVKWNLVAVAQE